MASKLVPKVFFEKLFTQWCAGGQIIIPPSLITWRLLSCKWLWLHMKPALPITAHSFSQLICWMGFPSSNEAETKRCTPSLKGDSVAM